MCITSQGLSGRVESLKHIIYRRAVVYNVWPIVDLSRVFFFLGLRQPEIETFLFNTVENFNIFNGVFILSMYVEVALKYWNIFSTCFKFETELCSIFIRDFLLRKMYKENGMLFVLFEYKNIYVELTGN